MVKKNYFQASEKWCGHPNPSFQCIDLTFIYSLLHKYGLKDRFILDLEWSELDSVIIECL